MKWLVVAALAGCGASERVTLDIERGSQPVYVVARDEGGDWEPATLLEIDGSDSRYDLGARAETFEVMFACLGPTTGQAAAVQLLWTQDAGAPVWACPAFFDTTKTMPGPTSVSVNGTMREPGTVSLLSTESADQANWQFAFLVDPGTFDLVATTAASQIFDRDPLVAIRRGFGVDATQTVEDVSLADEGVQARLFEPRVVNNAPGPIALDLAWRTAHGVAHMPSEGPHTILPAKSQLEAGDRLELELVVADDTQQQAVRALLGDDLPAELQLLPPLGAANGFVASSSHGGLRASWTDLGVPSYTAMVAKLGFEQQVAATKTWVDEHPEHVVAFDVTAPGLDDRFLVPDSTEGGCVQVVSLDGPITTSSGTCSD